MRGGGVGVVRPSKAVLLSCFAGEGLEGDEWVRGRRREVEAHFLGDQGDRCYSTELWSPLSLSCSLSPSLRASPLSNTNCLLLRNPLPLSRPAASFYWLISLFFNIRISTPHTAASPLSLPPPGRPAGHLHLCISSFRFDFQTYKHVWHLVGMCFYDHRYSQLQGAAESSGPFQVPWKT